MTATHTFVWPSLFLILFAKVCFAELKVALHPTSFVVAEGEQFTIRGTPDRIPDKDAFIVMEVFTVDGVKIPSSEAADSDFVGVSHPFIFQQATSPEPQFVTFTVKDDNLPEGNETYLIRATVTTPAGTASVSPSEIRVTILSNDDAYGVFSITNESPLTVKEPTSGRYQIDLNIERSQGLFGEVTIAFQVVGENAEARPDADISPSSGEIAFTPSVRRLRQKLFILPDEVPEMEETFVLTLRVVGSDGRVNETRSTLRLVVQANDAPLRFAKAEYRVSETNETKVINIEVTRGLSADGSSSVGPSTGLATVEYFFVAESAQADTDFVGLNGSLGFAEGIQRLSIPVQILADNEPENTETFSIHLMMPSGDVVLRTPSVAKVLIEGNDDHNGVLGLAPGPSGGAPIVLLNEDDVGAADAFRVVRTGGVFGLVSVRWRLTRVGGSDPVSADLSPTEGTVSLENGVRASPIRLALVQDAVAEPVETFRLELLPKTVTGGARAEGLLQGTLRLTDSDDAYGAVQFAPGSDQSIVRTTTSRLLRLTLERVGGTFGTIAAQVKLSYSANPNIGDILITNGSDILDAVFTPSQSLTTLNVQLLKSAFLKIGATFTARLINVTLTDGNIGYNSPRLASRLQSSVLVTAEHADGEIGFASTEPVDVVEPDGTNPLAVALRVTREGTSQDATVSWVVTANASVTASDLRAFSGNFTMVKGQSTHDLVLHLLPDNEPETLEELLVQLTAVEPRATQRIKASGRSVKVRIAESDNPGGTFALLDSMDTHYSTQEGGVPINVTVVRTGGALVTRFVEYVVTPGGDAEFFGGVNILRFDPGVTSAGGTLLARKDNIPEFDEVFVLMLRPYGNPAAVIGEKRSVNITIVRNENPYGAIEFHPHSLNTTIDESKGLNVYSANLRVLRTRGRFGVVHVTFAVEPGNTGDLRPITGQLEFRNDQAEVALIISSMMDDIPEEQETFTVYLRNATGGAVIGTRSTATINIRRNDDPVTFAEPSSVSVEEGSNVTLVVTRGGPPLRQVLIRYRTIGVTAESGIDFVAAAGQLVFNIGVVSLNLSVSTIEDTKPEGYETFEIELYDPQGDIVPFGNSTATVIIVPNDDAGGIFSFGQPFTVDAKEGVDTALNIVRARGHFGSVTVGWAILRNETDEVLPNGEDFGVSIGTVNFTKSETTKSLSLRPLADGIPEHGEMFRILLINVSGGASASQPAQLASGNLSVMITVLANDDPFGVLGFAATSRQRSVAEDTTDASDNRSHTVFTVERRQGVFGNIAAVWGLFADPAVTLPVVWDLIFYGVAGSGVALSNTDRLPGSGTSVAIFSGGNNSIIAIPSTYTPTKASIESGFSVSLCFRLHSSTQGILLAKSNANGSVIRYGLQLNATREKTSFRWLYSTSTKQNQFLTLDLAKSLVDNKWHCLVIIIDNSRVEGFLDSDIMLPAATMTAPTVQDGPGELTVGARPVLKSDRVQMWMQNVRIYSRRLSAGEIKEVLQRQAFNDVRPLSGIINFAQNVNNAEILVHSQPDSEEEGNEIFSLRLLSVRGGARLSPSDSAAILTVLKSDNANGLFGLYTGCTSTPTPAVEGASFSCPVARQRGSLSSVTLFWVMQQYNSTTRSWEHAVGQFQNDSGNIRFAAGEREQTIQFLSIDDFHPELSQIFRILLTSAVSADGEIGTTNSSGASVDKKHSDFNFTLPNNDFPYGLIQFMVEVPNPLPPVVLAATSRPKVMVSEEAGYIQLAVVRAQGEVGDVSVEWRTVDGTATSLGSQADFKADGNRLIFGVGERVRHLNVTLYDDSMPEDDRSFFVQLLNPTGGAQVGPGSTIEIVIRHSDDAFGVFSFKPPAYQLVAEGQIAKMTIERSGGNLRQVIVEWQATSGAESDLEVVNGTTTFKPGQSTAVIDVPTTDDKIAETREKFMIRLINSSLGRIDDNSSTASVEIKANDDIYGIFSISNTSRLIKIEENSSVVVIDITRDGGKEGKVRVLYQTSLSLHSMTTPRVDHLANSSDFRPIENGFLIFEAGQETGNITISIINDELPEADETFFVELMNVTLLGTSIDGQQPKLSKPNTIWSQVVILQNDDAHGVVELSCSEKTVFENFTGPLVSLIRKRGMFGRVSFNRNLVDFDW